MQRIPCLTCHTAGQHAILFPMAANPVAPPDAPYIEFKHVFKAFGSREILKDVLF